VLQAGEVDQTTYLCTSTPKTVFVTSTTTVGSFGSVSAADAVCQARANAANLTGTYLAWIADSASSAPSARFTRSLMPYVLVNGLQVAGNWANLADGTLDRALNVTELGATYNGPVWTATLGNGNWSAGATCSGWTAASPVAGGVGVSSETNSAWSFAGSSGCSNAYPFYCVQQ